MNDKDIRRGRERVLTATLTALLASAGGCGLTLETCATEVHEWGCLYYAVVAAVGAPIVVVVALLAWWTLTAGRVRR
jgi:hypothetical protein